MKRVASRLALGELEHPESGATHLGRVALLVTKAWQESLKADNEFKVEAGDYVMGDYIVLRTPNGKILEELHAVGVPVGVSSRGRGDVQTNPDDQVEDVQDNYECDTWDAVYQPSVVEAFPQPTSETKEPASETLIAEARSLIAKEVVTDILPLVETSSQIGELRVKLMEVETDEAKRIAKQLEERHGVFLQKIRELQKDSGADAPVQNRKVDRRSPAVEQDKVTELCTTLAERVVRAEKKLQLMETRSPTHGKESGALQKRYDAAVELADALLGRARREKVQRTVVEKKLHVLEERHNVLLQLAHGLRERFLARSKPPVEAPVEERKKVTGQRLVEVTSAKIVDPGRSLRKREVQESAQPQTLVSMVAKRFPVDPSE